MSAYDYPLERLGQLDKSLNKDLPLERLGQLDKPLNKLNELAALRMLSGVAAIALAQFKTTLADDKVVLAAESMPVASSSSSEEVVRKPLSDELRLSIRFRSEKKKILSKAIQALGQEMQKLSAAGSG
eukprot:gene20879-27721_t